MKTLKMFVFLAVLIALHSSAFSQYDALTKKKFQDNCNCNNLSRKMIPIDPENLEFSGDSIFLNLDHSNRVQLESIIFDGKTYFIGHHNDALLWGMMLCTKCGYMTTSSISICPRCGSTDIVVVDNWPES